jgi:CRISPR/Cas system-associated exonuclease Cas4 (RecB family)
MNSKNPRVPMARESVSRKASSRAAGWRCHVRRVVVLTIVGALQVAQAQTMADGCDLIRQAAQDAKAREVAAISAREDMSKQVLTNAMNCLQRVKQMLEATIPGINLAQVSMQQVLNYLSNRACQVVVSNAQQAMAPATQATQNLNNAAGQVNSATSNAIGTPVVQTSGPSVGAGGGQASPGGGTSVWDRVGCAFGRGPNCNR